MNRSAPVYGIVDSDDGIAALEADWKALQKVCHCHPFQTHEYIMLWLQAIGSAEGVRPLVVTMHSDDRLVAVMPTSRRVVRGMPAITWLGGPRSLDYGDILFDPACTGSCVDAFVDTALALIAKAAPVSTLYLTNVRSDALAHDALSARLRVLKHSTAPYLTIGGEWADYLASRKHTLRSNLDRKQRRMERADAVVLELLQPGDQRIPKTMAALVDYQRDRFKRLTARTALYHEHQVRFRLLQAMQHPDSRLYRLMWGDRVLAASLHACRGRRMYNLTGGFDPENSSFSPGAILQRYIICRCFSEDLDVYDFCWGGETYKYDWASGETGLTTFVSDNTRGRLLTLTRDASRKLASLFGSLPDDVK